MSELVKGYAKLTDDNLSEILYIVTENGDVYRSNEIKLPNYNFDAHARNWTKIDSLPTGCEFIGNYKKPYGLV